MAFTYDTKVNGVRGNQNPKTISITCNAASKLVVLTIVVDGGTARSGGAPTFDGNAMTQIDQVRVAASSPETNVEMWYYLNPATGVAKTISVPNAGTLYLTLEASSWKPAGGNKPNLRLQGGNSGTGTNPQISTSAIDYKAGDLLIAVIGSGKDTTTGNLNALSGTSATNLYSVDDGSYVDKSDYYLHTVDNNYQSYYAEATSEDFAICYAVFSELADLNAMGVSKANAYAVLAPPAAIDVSKAVAYAVISTEVTICVSKAVAYAVLAPAPNEDNGPMMWIF